MKSRTFLVIIVSLISILFSGCFGTKTIAIDHRVIQKKEKVLLYQSEKVYAMINFSFNSTELTGELWKSTFPDLPKSKKVKYLEVYLNPGFTLPLIDDNNNYFVEIPYDSISKVERTRFRIEYGLLIIPIYVVGAITAFAIGSSFQ